MFIQDRNDEWRAQLSGEQFLKVVRDRSSPFLDFIIGKEVSPFDWGTKISRLPVQIRRVYLESLEVVADASGKEGVKIVYRIPGANHNHTGQPLEDSKDSVVIDGTKGVTIKGLSSFQKELVKKLIKEGIGKE